jgi:gliding motility-associated-like protein
MKNIYAFLHISRLAKKKQATMFVIVIIGLLPFKLFGQAPTISYNSPQTFITHRTISPLAPTSTGVAAPTGAYGSPVVLGSGLTFSQNGLALDAAGNMYVNDQVGGTGVVEKISADGSSTTIIGSGFLTQSSNVAVDQTGNVFVADQSTVWKIPASGSPVTYGTPIVINNTFTRPFGIAVDASGNIYVTDLSVGGVYKMANDGTGKVRIDSGIGSPDAVAVDAAGNVYATDNVTNTLYEIPNGSAQVVLATGFSFPRGLAVDGAGNIYVDDEGASGIYQVPPGGGSPVAVVPGLNSLVGVAVDANYNLYAALQGSGGISKLSPTGGYFISPALPNGLSIDATTGVISGRPTVASAVADYLVSAYNSSGGASATLNITVNTVPVPTISYSTPQTYTAGTAITPLAPASSGVSTPGYSTPFPVGAGFSQPGGVVVDGAGNVYVADAGNGLVTKIPVNGSPAVTIASGLNYPTGVAIDSLGNIYVADQGAGTVLEIPVGGGSPVSIGSVTFFGPNAVAVDPAGNVYVGDGSAGALYKIPVDGGATISLGSGFLDLTAIAADAAGNLYVADGGASNVYKISAVGGVPVPLHHTFSFPSGVGVDASGNIYVTDADSNAVFKIPPGRGPKVNIGAGFNNPGGLAVDGAGNVYIADTDNNGVEEISPVGGYYVNRALPHGLMLNDTTGVISGTSTVASPATNYIITAYDAGGGSAAVVNITVNLPSPPAISYAGPQVYTAGTAITALVPGGTGVSAPGYNSTFVNIGTGFSFPSGVAIDHLGNIYVADAGNNAVEEIPFGGGPQISIGTGFNSPEGVAVDAAGNVYVADSGNGAVVKIPAGGGAQVNIGSGCGCGGGGFNFPVGIAVDAAGNVYVADAGDGNVYKIPVGGGPTVFFGPPFASPSGVAVDAAGNVYVSDSGSAEVFEFPAKGGKPQKIGYSFNFPTAVTVDAAGDVFVSDGAGSLVKEFPAGGGTPVTIGGLGVPYGTAVDGAGNLYITDVGDNTVKEVAPIGGYYINPSLPGGLSFESSTGIISGTPTVASPATDYTITAYNPGGSNSAILNITVNLPPLPTISYTSPQNYPKAQPIAPLGPASSGVGVPGYSSSPVSIGSGFNIPSGVAVDAAGNVYVADAGNNAVKKIPVGGGAPIILASVFSSPYGVAVDGAGNVYVADNGHNTIKKIPAGGGAPAAIGFGFSGPTGVAVDAKGNVYVADNGNNAIKEIRIHGGVVTLGTGLGGPTSVAVDADGNVYFTEFDSNDVKMIAAGGGTPVTIGSFFGPYGVAVDAAGNVFVSDYGNNAVREILKSGGAPVVIGSGFNFPGGVAVDGSGNVFVGDAGNNMVDEIKPAGGYYLNPALPAGLSFDSATGIISGTPTVISPATNYIVNAYNYGGSSQATVKIKISSSNANLAKLKLNAGGLSPAFATGITSYTSSVGNNIASITVTPTTIDTTATVAVNSTSVASGTASAGQPLTVGPNTISIVVTAGDGTTTNTYTITVTRAPSVNAKLAWIHLGTGTLSPVFAVGTTSYTANVSHATSSITVTPTTSDPNATVTVNGTAVTSGTASSAIPLSVGPNTITLIGTAQNGTTTKTYTVTVTRAPSTNAMLAWISLDQNTYRLSPGFTPATTSYTANVPNVVSSITVMPIAVDATAVVTVNGTAVSSGSSLAIPLTAGANTITLIGTAQDGITTKTYTVTVTRALSTNAKLAWIRLSSGTLSPGFSAATTGYTANVSNATTSITVTPTVVDATATVTVNGTAVTSGTASTGIALSQGPNIITLIGTAQDGVTTKTYTVTVTRATGPIPTANPQSFVAQTTASPQAEDGVLVHQGVSVNGDGMNDFLNIEGITNYPDNKLMIMNRNGVLVYEAKGYDNSSRKFDGHSNKTGTLQQPGTYFYSLEYKAGGVSKRKTGFIILKY